MIFYTLKEWTEHILDLKEVGFMDILSLLFSLLCTCDGRIFGGGYGRNDCEKIRFYDALKVGLFFRCVSVSDALYRKFGVRVCD